MLVVSSNVYSNLYKVEPINHCGKANNKRKQKCSAWRPCLVCTQHDCDTCPFMCSKHKSKEWLV